MASRSWRPLVFLAVLVFLGGCARGCTQQETDTFIDQFLESFYGKPVTVTAGDKTPPTVKIVIPALGLTIDQTATAPIKLRVSDLPSKDFFAFVTAEDPEGVQKVCVLPSGSTVCTCGNVTSTQGGIYVQQCDGILATPGQAATTKRSIVYPIDVSGFNRPCDAGCTGRRDFGISATGVNFSGQQTGCPGVDFYVEQK